MLEWKAEWINNVEKELQGLKEDPQEDTLGIAQSITKKSTESENSWQGWHTWTLVWKIHNYPWKTGSWNDVWKKQIYPIGWLKERPP